MLRFPESPIFKSGDRVKVVRYPSKYYKERLIGLIGVVRQVYGKDVSVLFDEVHNKRSQYGSFYFVASELELVDRFNNEIMEDKNMPKITNYLNAVTIKFIGDADPCKCVYANFDAGLTVGDLCVVKPAHHSMTLARVEKFIDYDGELQREVVAKVCTDDYDARLKARAKAAELKSKMEARAKQLQDIALYQMLAKDDPDMAALLQEYQDIPKT